MLKINLQEYNTEMKKKTILKKKIIEIKIMRRYTFQYKYETSLR